jgi:hypothetical protein
MLASSPALPLLPMGTPVLTVSTSSLSMLVSHLLQVVLSKSLLVSTWHFDNHF